MLVAEPRRRSWPALGSAQLAGSLSLDVSARRGAGGLEAASGRLAVDTLSAHLPGSASLRALSLELPFAYDSRLREQPRREGSLSLAGLQAAGLSLPALSLKLHLAGDSLVVAQPVELALYGGHLRLGGLTASGLAGPGRSARIEGVSLSAPLAELSRGLLGKPIRGQLAGSLPEVAYGQGRWQGSGALVASGVFGGSVEVRDPWVADPLRASRKYGADITFDGISLEALTTFLTGFGRVTGTIEGYLRDFEMSYGQPASFRLLIETEDGREPKRVSLEAVQSISTIGTGAATGLEGIFFDLLSEFRFSKIGISASLHNDVFRLRGTIHEGGTEYLVRRTWLGGIDVVNRNPGNAISFKDMRQRLARIFERKAEFK